MFSKPVIQLNFFLVFSNIFYALLLNESRCISKVLEKSLNVSRLKEIAKIKEGDIIENCTCKSITSWGAFFSYGNLELLVHINECAWNRISSPSEILEVGTTSYRVKVIKIDGTRISGSLKRLFPDPFVEAAKKYKPAILGPKKITIILVIPILDNELKRFDKVENLKKSIYLLKFFIMLF